MPAARQRCTSSRMAFAVMEQMGSRVDDETSPRSSSYARIDRVASYPSMTGISQSISTMPRSAYDVLTISTASAPLCATYVRKPMLEETTRSTRSRTMMKSSTMSTAGRDAGLPGDGGGEDTSISCSVAFFRSSVDEGESVDTDIKSSTLSASVFGSVFLSGRPLGPDDQRETTSESTVQVDTSDSGLLMTSRMPSLASALRCFTPTSGVSTTGMTPAKEPDRSSCVSVFVKMSTSITATMHVVSRAAPCVFSAIRCTLSSAPAAFDAVATDSFALSPKKA
mmetsp:Transcript_10156/g.32203  ORF Transcript_10156/g.32203 Transcript_10156/m.32203 type:complete len:281 (-) Transcript_10156:283-1125(-)